MLFQIELYLLYLLFAANAQNLNTEIGDEIGISANKETTICYTGSPSQWIISDLLFANIAVTLSTRNGIPTPFAVNGNSSCLKPNIFDSLQHLSLSLRGQNYTVYLSKAAHSCFTVCPSSTSESDTIFIKVGLEKTSPVLCALLATALFLIAFAPLIAQSKLFYLILGALCGISSFTVLFTKIIFSLRKIRKLRLEVLFMIFGISTVAIMELLKHLKTIVVISGILSLSLGASLAYIFIDKIINPRTVRVVICNIQLFGILIIVMYTDYLTFSIPAIVFLLLFSLIWPISMPTDEISQPSSSPPSPGPGIENQPLVTSTELKTQSQLNKSLTTLAESEQHKSKGTLCPECYVTIINLLSSLTNEASSNVVITENEGDSTNVEESPIDLSVKE